MLFHLILFFFITLEGMCLKDFFPNSVEPGDGSEYFLAENSRLQEIRS
jgi:hypothetical protein